MLAAMHDPRTLARQAAWSRHWASGAAHSCAGSYGATYGGAVAAFWRDVCERTPAPARALDIATGSGAIPRLWRGFRTGDAWDAVDLAPDAPAWMRGAGPDLRFHGGAMAEALPFGDAFFDLVTSQYGLEYGDLERAVPELLRVRRPDGRIALVLHHAGSRPVALAAVELGHLDWLAGADGLLPACEGMLRPLAQARTPEGRARLAGDAAAEAARERFNAAQDALAARASAAPDGADVLGEVQDTVAGVLGAVVQQGEAAGRQALQALVQGLADSRLRLQELRDCALDDTAAQALRDRLAAAGLRTVLAPLHEGPHLMGWTLLAEPA